MALRVDDRAESNYAGIVALLRQTRLEARTTQNALAVGLPVRGRAISEWEKRTSTPSLDHLIQWPRPLGLQLVIEDRNGEVLHDALRRRPGESWVDLERRRLAWRLKGQREGSGMYKATLAQIVGVSEDSIRRWESAAMPPRSIALVVWSHGVGCRVTLRRSKRYDRRGAGSW